MTAGESAVVNVASNFSDPDGDRLTYEAATTNVGVAGISASGATITITAVAAGSATVTITARDPGGLTAALSFAVTVHAAGAPDLVVGPPSVSDSSPTAGASFTLRATVRNEGTASSPATTLRYYRSNDATVTASDTEVGTDAVGALSASATSAESIGLTAPSSAGTYYYGACVDAVTGESDTTDNCSSAVAVTVGTAGEPDLVVESPSVSDSSPTAGASFTLSATVRNRGTTSAVATTLRYYRSTDATITTSDTEVGTDAVGSLSASATSAESIGLTAPSNAGTYYYGACVDAVTGESDTTDNCSSAVAITVGAAGEPDLVVESPSVSDSSPTAGASFTLSATVRNRGTTSAVATTLRYYRSTDATITTSDTEVGTDAVRALPASATSLESIGLTAPSSAGTYYYGACVDAVTGESDTTDNCSSAVAITVGAAGEPDLVVESPSVSDSSPTAGASFRLRATVRNEGTASSPATTLRYYLSTDATITASDTEVGTDAVRALPASATSAEWISLTAPSNAGTYYYGACVDAVTGESDTTDNCSSAVAITVGAAGAPDLVVQSPSVSDSSPTAGASFTLRATVRNEGTASSLATTLRYYLSTDATITTSDTEVGTDAVRALPASATSLESISLTAPSSAGMYYYGACVDAVAGESDTTDNCSSAVAVTVGAAGAPDLVVESPSVSDSSPTAGASFRLRATVRNEGTASSLATTLRYYLSSDATITTSDTEVGTDAVRALPATATSPESIGLTAPSSAGTYYYGACVDAVAGESDTTDNCSSAVAVTVGAAGAPDLVVESPSVSDSSPTAGASFRLRAMVRNEGTASSLATTLRYYLSSDATITTSDTEVGTDAVRALPATATSPESIGLTAPSSAGTYYYGACVDAVAGESDTTDNCSSAVAVTVGAAGAPDLVVGPPSVSDSSPTAGASFTLNATVRNEGTASSPATTLRYYRSTDATITASDPEVGTDAVRALSASATSAESIGLTAPSSAGTYYYGACVDAVTGESDTADNCSSAVAITVGATGAPDLVVESPSVSDSSPTAGASFTLNATVRNEGTASSSATTLRYYRSTDATVTASDTEVGTDAVRVLSASATSAESIGLTAPSSAGTYYYGACVDAVTGESDTADNCSSAVAVTVGAAGAPDLVVESPSVSDSSPTAGASFTLRATVRNEGTASSLATTLRYYRSTDATVTTSDTEVGTDAVGALSASATSAESINLTAPSSAGTYYYGACVDAVASESDTTDNCSSAVAIAVGVRTTPDLVVGTPTVSESSPLSGASFTLNATVRNEGTASSPATTLRYYRSSDATITTSDTAVGTDAVGALSASATSAESIDLTAPSSAGTYYYGACADAVTGESDTTNNCSSAVTVTVADPPPDLVVGTPTVSESSPLSGTSFTLRATVRNEGTASSPATTLRYYRSSDATITISDTEEGTDAVGALSASATSAESIDLTAPSSAGTYYYGACADAVTGESDTTNNCSSAVTVTVDTPPDLVVGTPTVSNSSPNTGASFTLSATVRNRGTTSAAATTLRYYRSSDATITTSDTAEGTDAVDALPGFIGRGESIDLTAPSSAGTYYYGACVDAVTGEGDTTNNCSSAVTVTVGVPAAPDLVVGTPSATNTTPLTNQGFTVNVTVTNEGDGPSVWTTLRLYRSTDATITTSDTEVRTAIVNALAASASSDESRGSLAPSSAGTYYYGVCVDAVRGESDTTNNCSSAVTITVSAADPPPDLVVDAPSANPTNPAAGARTTLSFTVRNRGTGSASGTELDYYRSTDATITTSDTHLATDDVPSLAASGTWLRRTRHRVPSTTGTYYYGACADPVVGEGNAGNNCSGSVEITVIPTWDLRVESPSVDDSSPETDASFTLSVTVSNRGNGPSPDGYLRYYRSTDATITTSDREEGTDDVDALAVSATSNESIELDAPSSAGTYYYGACITSREGDSDTTNDCSSAVTVTVVEADAVTGSITKCEATQSGTSWSVVIEGTLTAVREVLAVTIEGYVGGSLVGSTSIGSISAGDSEDFSITGTFSSRPSGTCTVDVEWTEISS